MVLYGASIYPLGGLGKQPTIEHVKDITWPNGDTKFLLRVLKKIFHSFAALTREIFFNTRSRNFVSPSDHVMFYLLYKLYIIMFYLLYKHQ